MTLKTLMKPLVVAGLLVSSLAQAAPSAQQVLEASPVDDIVVQYPAMMGQGIRDGLKQKAQLPPMVADTIAYVVQNSFRPEEIKRKIAANLETSLSDEQLAKVHDWYQRPVARKIARAEVAASAPAIWPQIRKKAPELNKANQGTDREERFERFDRAARASESAVDTAIALQLGLSSALAAVRGEPANPEATRQQLEAQRPALQGVVRKQVYDSYLYTYQKISPKEMEMYLEFLESDAGRQFTKVVVESIQQAVTEPIENIGNQLARFRNLGNESAQ
ncbi:DUF2059 domain-containing protein [Marinobacter litoralis]|uniref:DUF2059 domain-containing protein n=1 Tax=Marinobacter litoralis TaxID=187981 RepID=UPI0018EB37D8|nr:DUF2059 domain-containing protein [Marinobacter litoralis]MBJ6137111.1 DUF2059 domain-containing protein [Marinobacter litoralis]